MAAFEEFVRTRGGSLSRAAYLLTGSRRRAERLLLAVLASARERWREVDAEGAAETWVRERMVAVMARRSRIRSPFVPALSAPEGLLPSEPDAVADSAGSAPMRDAVADRWEVALLAAVLARLPAADRIVLYRCCEERAPVSPRRRREVLRRVSVLSGELLEPPAPDNPHRLADWEVYQRLGDLVPALVGPDDVGVVGRRRRYVVAVVVALIVMVVVSSVVFGPESGGAPSDSPPPDEKPALEEQLDSGAEPTDPTSAWWRSGRAGSGGTIEGPCRPGDCRLRIDGHELFSGDPGTSRALERFGPEGLSWSWNGSWIGFREPDGGYGLRSLGENGSFGISSRSGTRLEPIGWTGLDDGSPLLYLAAYRNDVLVDLLTVAPQGDEMPVSHPAPFRTGMRPIDVCGQRCLVFAAEPLVLPDDPPIQTLRLHLVRADWPDGGKVGPDGWSIETLELDLAEKMEPGESLRGPHGLPTLLWGPEPKGILWTMVWERPDGVDEPHATAVLGVDPSGSTGDAFRLDLPEWAEVDPTSSLGLNGSSLVVFFQRKNGGTGLLGWNGPRFVESREYPIRSEDHGIGTDPLLLPGMVVDVPPR